MFNESITYVYAYIEQSSPIARKDWEKQQHKKLFDFADISMNN